MLELLTEKFNLFNGVFGASDDVLGSIESGVDFEKRILSIYQECRTPDEIETAFKALQAEMDERIQARMSDTRKMLLENFDEDVHERLSQQSAQSIREVGAWVFDEAHCLSKWGHDFRPDYLYPRLSISYADRVLG